MFSLVWLNNLPVIRLKYICPINCNGYQKIKQYECFFIVFHETNAVEHAELVKVGKYAQQKSFIVGICWLWTWNESIVQYWNTFSAVMNIIIRFCFNNMHKNKPLSALNEAHLYLWKTCFFKFLFQSTVEPPVNVFIRLKLKCFEQSLLSFSYFRFRSKRLIHS